MIEFVTIDPLEPILNTCVPKLKINETIIIKVLMTIYTYKLAIVIILYFDNDTLFSQRIYQVFIIMQFLKMPILFV